MMENILIQSQNMSEFNTPEFPVLTNEQMTMTMPVPYFPYPPYPFHPESPWIYMVPYMPGHYSQPQMPIMGGQQFTAYSSMQYSTFASPPTQQQQQNVDLEDHYSRRSRPYDKVQQKSMMVTKKAMKSVSSIPWTKVTQDEGKVVFEEIEDDRPVENTSHTEETVEIQNPVEVNEIQIPVDDHVKVAVTGQVEIEEAKVVRHWKKNILATADEITDDTLPSQVVNTVEEALVAVPGPTTNDNKKVNKNKVQRSPPTPKLEGKPWKLMMELHNKQIKKSKKRKWEVNGQDVRRTRSKMRESLQMKTRINKNDEETKGTSSLFPQQEFSFTKVWKEIHKSLD